MSAKAVAAVITVVLIVIIIGGFLYASQNPSIVYPSVSVSGTATANNGNPVQQIQLITYEHGQQVVFNSQLVGNPANTVNYTAGLDNSHSYYAIITYGNIIQSTCKTSNFTLSVLSASAPINLTC